MNRLQQTTCLCMSSASHEHAAQTGGRAQFQGLRTALPSYFDSFEKTLFSFGLSLRCDGWSGRGARRLLQLQFTMNPMYFRLDVTLIVAFHQFARFGEQCQCYVDLAEIAQCFCYGGSSPGMRQLVAGRGESARIASASGHLIYSPL